MNLDELFRASVTRAPQQVAIVQGQQELTYTELDEAIDRAKAQLVDAQVRPGDSVGLHVASGLNYIVLTYAAWRAGACIVPIPIELANAEKSRILQEIHLDFVINAEPQASFIDEVALRTHQLLDGTSVVAVRKLREAPPQFSSINAAFIRFTSGTTGTAKGVVLSHETIFERISAAKTPCN